MRRVQCIKCEEILIIPDVYSDSKIIICQCGTVVVMVDNQNPTRTRVLWDPPFELITEGMQW